MTNCAKLYSSNFVIMLNKNRQKGIYYVDRIYSFTLYSWKSQAKFHFTSTEVYKRFGPYITSLTIQAGYNANFTAFEDLSFEDTTFCAYIRIYYASTLAILSLFIV